MIKITQKPSMIHFSHECLSHSIKFELESFNKYVRNIQYIVITLMVSGKGQAFYEDCRWQWCITQPVPVLMVSLSLLNNMSVDIL